MFSTGGGSCGLALTRSLLKISFSWSESRDSCWQRRSEKFGHLSMTDGENRHCLASSDAMNCSSETVLQQEDIIPVPVVAAVTPTGANENDDRNKTDDDDDINSDHADRAESEEGVNTGAEMLSKRKKHRRGKSKKRKWRPYYKLTWQEKRELEDRESKRATRIRAERFAHGQPVAPYNTTSFIMEDHNVEEPDLEHIANGHRHQHRDSNSFESSDEFYSSPEDEEDFLQKDFSIVYEKIHTERLQTLTKDELIQELLQLEDRVDKLEQKLKAVETIEDEGRQIDWREQAEKARIFEEEIRALKVQNEQLRFENRSLREQSENSAVSAD